MTDDRRSAPHVARNAGPIADVLASILPERGLVLELASGTGQHIVHFARTFPGLTWQPSDPDPAALASIAAWCADADLPNLRAPLALDARAMDWPLAQADALIAINMVHISPWEATQGLLRGAARLLGPGAPLFLYGAYFQQGIETAPSNLAFDQSLRMREPDWGLRQVEDVVSEAEGQGFRLQSIVPMPANNLSIIFRRV